jgi:hypothetical protein
LDGSALDRALALAFGAALAVDLGSAFALAWGLPLPPKVRRKEARVTIFFFFDPTPNVPTRRADASGQSPLESCWTACTLGPVLEPRTRPDLESVIRLETSTEFCGGGGEGASGPRSILQTVWSMLVWSQAKLGFTCRIDVGHEAPSPRPLKTRRKKHRVKLSQYFGGGV